MTFKEHVADYLDRFGLMPQEIGEIQKQLEETRPELKGRLNESTAEYHPAFMAAVRVAAHMVAIEWLQTNKPKSWVLTTLKAGLNP